ncbi:hypothetical protein D3C76_960780 [compost metagenome]
MVMASAIRLCAVPKCASSCSMPMKRRPNSMQATPVVPLPMVLSSTTWPGLVYVAIRNRIQLTGF